jgi:hypothetical protein
MSPSFPPHPGPGGRLSPQNNGGIGGGMGGGRGGPGGSRRERSKKCAQPLVGAIHPHL